MPTPSSRILRALMRATLAVAVLACADTPMDPGIPAGMARLRLHANLLATPVHTLVVEVTGPGISGPLAFNMTVDDGTASGTVTIPAGSDRTITMRAYDVGGVETHRGMKVMDVVEGTNGAVNITLTPLRGDVPIVVQLGSFVIELNGPVWMYVGDTATIEATVWDALGNELAGPVRWAVTNPSRGLIDTTGRLFVRDTGDVQVVATYDGFSAATTIAGTPLGPDARTWIGGSPGATNDWHVGANWWPRGRPGVNDSVIVNPSPFGVPVMSDPVEVGAVVVGAGAGINLGTNYFRVRRTIVAGANITNGITQVVGDGATIQGTIQELDVRADAALAENLTVVGELWIFDGGSLDVAARTASIGVDLRILDSARLVMDGSSDLVIVERHLDFASSVNHEAQLTDGFMYLGGSIGGGGSFRTGGAHWVALSGASGTQYIDGGEGTSRIANLFIEGAAAVEATCGVDVPGAFLVNSATSVTLYCTSEIGQLSTVAGSSFTAAQVVLNHGTALNNVAGSFAASTTTFNAAGQTMRADIPYNSVVIADSANVATQQAFTGVDGNLFIYGQLWIRERSDEGWPTMTVTGTVYVGASAGIVNDGDIGFNDCVDVSSEAWSGFYGKPEGCGSPAIQAAPNAVTVPRAAADALNGIESPRGTTRFQPATTRARRIQ